ncbi:MAG: ATP-binding protein [Hyphomonadaceae bacterium]|nr:ATP-binding protein [Hyphomonadaceae bacterium]GIK49277.1 MAG: ATPase [Alphaproteobacteria bacterium]
MASAQQLIGLVKSHAEGDEARFYDLAIQLAAAEEQKGHKRLAADLRRWAESIEGRDVKPRTPEPQKVSPLAAPRGDLAEVLAATYPRERMNELVLAGDIQGELNEVIVETRGRERLEEKGFAPRRKLLLAGPPGVGKTMTARALAGELHLPLFSVQLHGLITKFYGETASKLRSIFDAIRTHRGVYFFDEIDALAAARGRGDDIGEARRVLNSFLLFLEEDAGPSIVIAATNLPELIDSAMLRRFDLTLLYRLPDASEVAEVIRRRLKTLDIDRVDWAKVGSAGLGLGQADLVKAAEDAGRRAVLAGRKNLSTTALVAALKKRHGAWELKYNAAAKSASSDDPDSGADASVPPRGRRRRKATK